MGKQPVRVDTEQQEAPLRVDLEGPGEAPTPAPPLPDAGGGVWLTYRGDADAVAIGEYSLKPGVPVHVPKDIAEALLIHPKEFEVSTEPPPPPLVEE